LQLKPDPLGGGGEALEHQATLHALAEVATAFAGFAGIVIVLGGRSGGTWKPGDVPLLVGLLACSLGVVFQYRSRRGVIARDASLFGSGSLLGVHYIGVFLVAALFLTASGLLSSWLFFFYLLNLLWLLLMATYAFAIFLVEAISSEPAA
jgi:hypothetical protein